MGKFTKIMSDNSNQFIFLGTGTSQGVPVIGCQHPVCFSSNPKDMRLRASAMIIYNNVHLLIDCGPDFRQQMLRENLTRVDAILVTHEHNDHIIGLDDVRPLNFRMKKDMPLYSRKRVLNEIKARFPYVFVEEKYPGAPGIQLVEIDENSFDIQGVKITPLPVMHGDLPIFGYRIGNLAYLTDISFIPDKTMELLKNLDILVIDALRKKNKHHSHLILDEAIEYAKKINAKKTYFTHINHEMGFYDEVESQLPPNMHLGFDGLKRSFT